VAAAKVLHQRMPGDDHPCGETNTSITWPNWSIARYT
jgi:hypothetical protein